MTDMIARKDVSGSAREAPKVIDSRPAYKQEDPSDQPPADIREQPLWHMLGAKISPALWLVRFWRYRFAKITEDPQVPIGTAWSGPSAR
jgi:hypothetical protein